MSPEQVIKRPIILTEKAAILSEEENQVIFEVDLKADKIDVKGAVEALFDVKVTSVNTLVQRGKIKRIGRKHYKRPNWKKAIVTLKDGDSIEFFDESGDEESED